MLDELPKQDTRERGLAWLHEHCARSRFAAAAPQADAGTRPSAGSPSAGAAGPRDAAATSPLRGLSPPSRSAKSGEYWAVRGEGVLQEGS
jgi:hypothetical protein